MRAKGEVSNHRQRVDVDRLARLDERVGPPFLEPPQLQCDYIRSRGSTSAW